MNAIKPPSPTDSRAVTLVLGEDLNRHSGLVPRETLATLLRGPILVVDDDADTREIIAEILTSAGYAVRCAENGAEAFRSLHANEALPRMILLDLDMPVMGGQEFLARRAGDARLSAIPVVIASATLRRVDGANAFLAKPLDLDGLLALVASYCDSPD